jgi:hypothetical protein
LNLVFNFYLFSTPCNATIILTYLCPLLISQVINYNVRDVPHYNSCNIISSISVSKCQEKNKEKIVTVTKKLGIKNKSIVQSYLNLSTGGHAVGAEGAGGQREPGEEPDRGDGGEDGGGGLAPHHPTQQDHGPEQHHWGQLTAQALPTTCSLTGNLLQANVAKYSGAACLIVRQCLNRLNLMEY